MNVLKTLLCGPRQARGMSNMAAIILAIVVLAMAGFLIKRLIGVAFVLLHWAITIGVLVAMILLVVLGLKYLAKKME